MLTRRTFCALLPGVSAYITHTLKADQQGSSTSPSDSLSENDWSFVNPPESARPYVLWMWMGSNISASGITADLEAMKSAGIGGATIFSLADSTVPWAAFIGKSPTPDVVTFTEPWWKFVRHAATECKRLGLELILHNCAGYESSGGPWITPELSMQEVVWSETKVSGGKFRGNLAKAKVDPHPHAQFPRVYIPALGRIDNPIVKARNSYYRDIAVIALPSDGTASADKVIDLTAHMNEAGEIDWSAPAGDWTIYRFGHTTTGAMIQPAQWDAMGLECDKMSAEAVTFHVKHVLSDMKRHLGDLMGGTSGTGLTTLYFDSYEAGTPTWTPKMREQFKSRRGYDLVTWLPALAGRTLQSESDTKKFHADFTQTVHDLYRECYWATPGPLAHEAGVKFVAEPYAGPWEISEVVKYLDVPTAEFWTFGGRYHPETLEPVVKAAHLLKDRIVAAESFTSAPEDAMWSETPAWLKPIGDAAFCDGINRVNVHHFVQQPWDARYKPGNVMGRWGVHFGRNQTWWEPGKAWFAYLWRCQNLLQRGRFVSPSPETSAGFTAFMPDENGLNPQFKSVRRDLGDASIFFVANTERCSGSVKIILPITGRQPELWDPVWGTMRDIQDYEQDGKTTGFTLYFASAQSFFLVFRKPLAKPLDKKTVSPQPFELNAGNTPVLETVATLEGSWHVAFDPAWGGPSSTVFESLTDWTLHPDTGIRYYSGAAKYTKTIHHSGQHDGRTIWLDLGVCHHIATVTVNGKSLGVVWTAPWRIDVSPAWKTGENRIEIEVANVWANRLIGDEQEPPDWIWETGAPELDSGQVMKEFPEWFLKNEPRPSSKRYTFTTWNYFNKKSPLAPSGLIGPVTLKTEKLFS